MNRTLADLGLAALELTLPQPAADPWTREGVRVRRVIVTLPFDYAEERDGHTYIRTAGGADLYVQESLASIRELLLAAKQPTAADPMETK